MNDDAFIDWYIGQIHDPAVSDDDLPEILKEGLKKLRQSWVERIMEHIFGEEDG